MENPLARAWRTWRAAWPYAMGASATGWLHLAEVHLVDAAAGAIARRATGWDFGLLARVEAPLAAFLGRLHHPDVVSLVALYYVGAFVTLLWGAPALVALRGDARLLRRALLLVPVVYALALPFYLLVPSVNPYQTIGAPSPFDGIHPEAERWYYLLTTPDNTFPSLHVAYTVALTTVAARAWPSLAPLLWTNAAALTTSVVFLRVHYVADAVGGALLALVALRLTARAAAPRPRPAAPDPRPDAPRA